MKTIPMVTLYKHWVHYAQKEERCIFLAKECQESTEESERLRNVMLVSYNAQNIKFRGMKEAIEALLLEKHQPIPKTITDGISFQERMSQELIW